MNIQKDSSLLFSDSAKTVLLLWLFFAFVFFRCLMVCLWFNCLSGLIYYLFEDLRLCDFCVFCVPKPLWTTLQ